MLALTTFGIPALHDGDGREIRLGKQEMALLVYLAVESGEPRGRDYLGDLLSWKSEDPRGLVNAYLSRLRKKLPGGCVVGGEAPRVSEVRCDAVVLRDTAANRSAPGWDALQLYRGRFLEHFFPGRHAAGFGTWAQTTARALRQRMEILWQREMNAALQGAGDWARVRELALWGLKVDGEWEEALARLMKAEMELGNPDAAIVWADPVLARLKKTKRSPPRQLTLLREQAEQARERQFAREAPPPPPIEMNSRGELLALGHVDWSGSVAAPRVEQAAARRGAFEWDLFVASPMDALSSDDLYEGDQRTVSGLVEKLRAFPGLERIFYAGETRPTRGHFNDPSVSLRGNLKALRASRAFVMIHPDRLPSSTVVEATFALAWEIPGILFVRRRDDLPFLLRSVTDVFPTMLVRTFVDLENLREVLLEELPRLVQRQAEAWPGLLAVGG